MPMESDPPREQQDGAERRGMVPAAGEAIASLQVRLLEMIAAGNPLDTILAELCRALEAREPGAVGAVFCRDADGPLRVGAAPSLPPVVAAALADALNQPGSGADSDGNVVSVDPCRTAWRDLAAHGLHACATAPIRGRAGELALGVFALFRRAPVPLAAPMGLLPHAAELARLAIEHDRVDGSLRDAETRYRTLVEQLPAIIYIEHLVGDTDLYLSPQVAAMLGYSAAELLAGDPAWKDLVHPDDQAWVEAAVRRSDATGAFDESYRMIARDGSIVWIRNQAILVEGERGLPAYWHGVVIDLTERKQTEDWLAYLAHHDALTGLPNRTLYMERLLAATQDPGAGDGPAVLFIDLDGFKNLNDSLGHDAGDQVLIEAAARLGSALDDADTLARFGGDEFVVLLERVSGADAAAQVADRLLAALGEPWSVNGCAARMSGSIGVAVMDGARPIEPEDLLREADIALYEAKMAGRATRIVYSPTRSAPAAARERSPRDPHQAMPEQEAVVRYRPEIELATGRIVRLDASALWHPADDGPLPPANFVRTAGAPEAEQRTGAWVLRQACRQARAWRDLAGGHAPGASVRLSAHEFCRSSLVDEIARAVAEADIDPAVLEVRISESTAAIVAREIVPQVRALGVRIAIDDFGKRDVPLAGLHDGPFDALWLDPAIVGGLGRDRRSTTAVRIITTLGRDAGLTIGAKGVSTQDQADALRQMGVELAQGEAIGHPLRAGAVAALLVSESPPQAGIATAHAPCGVAAAS